MKKTKIICIVGATASGKTDLSVKLAKAIGGEIISADSMQVYRDMPIATAVATQDEQDGVRHHLVEFFRHVIDVVGMNSRCAVIHGRPPIGD